MPVMTISRETGSQGRYIAEQVAKKLGYHFADKNVIGRIFSKYGADEYGIETGYVPDFWTHFGEQAEQRREFMVRTLNEVILALAHLGNIVIVGRSSFAVLGAYADVLNVRIQAPRPLRIQRVMERRQIDAAQAEAAIDESDRIRAAFINSFYKSAWDRAKCFDLVIDTGKVAPGMAIKWLVETLNGLQETRWNNLETTGTIHVDPILSSVVASEFHQWFARR